MGLPSYDFRAAGLFRVLRLSGARIPRTILATSCAVNVQLQK